MSHASSISWVSFCFSQSCTRPSLRAEAEVLRPSGILDLAVKHYEKVLELKDADTQDTASGMELDENAGNPAPKIDLSKEAAYNLSLIYFTRNAPDLARTVVDKYLSL